MQKKCDNCGKVLNIPDDKIPEGKTVIVTCPSCSEKIRIKKEEQSFDFEEGGSDIPDFGDDFADEPDFSEEKKPAAFSDDNSFEDDESSGGDPFDFIEEEGQMAMVCSEDEKMKKEAATVLEYLEYSVFLPQDNHQALRELRMRGEFSLIVVDENFCCDDIKNNAVVRYVKRLSMRDRREIFVLLVSSGRRTLDRKDAFAHSVNMIINSGHMASFEDFLKKGFTENENFYRNFKETLKKGLRF
jgi:DNA-directed RNA polymerase subunit RPC12/RpoP